MVRVMGIRTMSQTTTIRQVQDMELGLGDMTLLFRRWEMVMLVGGMGTRGTCGVMEAE